MCEAPFSRVVRQVFDPRMSRSWHERSDDKSLDVIDEGWILQDLLKTCAFIKSFFKLDYHSIGLSALDTGDVITVGSLEWVLLKFSLLVSVGGSTVVS